MSSKGKWHEEKWGTNEEPVETPTERPHCDDEPIMIDGVDVSKCRYFRPGSALTCSRMYGGACDNKYSNELCYFKQLAHKTRECEELSNEIEELNVKYETVVNLAKKNADANEYCLQELEKENQKLKQALDEIEGLATNLRTRTDYHSEEEVNADIENILDIISKAKGGRK